MALQFFCYSDCEASRILEHEHDEHEDGEQCSIGFQPESLSGLQAYATLLLRATPFGSAPLFVRAPDKGRRLTPGSLHRIRRLEGSRLQLPGSRWLRTPLLTFLPIPS
jgi:hypothetical protein